jgi:hypothetical protein
LRARLINPALKHQRLLSRDREGEALLALPSKALAIVDAAIDHLESQRLVSVLVIDVIEPRIGRHLAATLRPAAIPMLR